jgi:hypothetical protein
MRVELRPPLPSSLLDRDAPFVAPDPQASALSPEVIVAIACTLNETLPQGDFTALPSGRITYEQPAPGSTWYRTGILEALERSAEL